MLICLVTIAPANCAAPLGISPHNDNVIEWKHFPPYWPFHKGYWRGAMLFFICALNKRLNKQSWGWWFETPSCSLWRHSNDYHRYYSHSWPHDVTSNFHLPLLATGLLVMHHDMLWQIVMNNSGTMDVSYPIKFTDFSHEHGYACRRL